MNFKKRVNGSWTDTPHYIHNTDTDILTTLPAVLYPNAATATVGLKGQTTQSSIPSPVSPVMPQGTGERTRNLCDKVFVSGYNIASNGYPTPYTPNNSRCATLEAIDVSNQNTVTFSYTNTVSDNKRFIYSLFNGNTLVIREADKSTGTTIDVSQGNKLYLCVYSNLASVNAAETTTNIMLNTGETALPYEPYGIKIPILSNSTTTPVYLGEVETTRKIKKLVLTGKEDWNVYSGFSAQNCYQFNTNITNHDANSEAISTHFTYTDVLRTLIDNDGTFMFDSMKYIRVHISSCTTLEDFKTYLQQQYAAGTPVTVWYVLANEETGIVNEPLMKIGDYADTVSGITIPTIAGANTISVGTTLQPSEVSVNYKGWHPVQSVHEAENGQWD